jgi:dUTP pyrophosphatase
MNYKKLYESAKTPTRGSEEAAGFDLYACGYENQMCNSENWEVYINPGDTIKINTGIAVAIPQGYFGGIYARSGLACKAGLAPANKVGIIDSDYRGELLVCLYNQSPVPQRLQKGDRIAQFILQEYSSTIWEEVENLDDTNRGDGGFGSTGVN